MAKKSFLQGAAILAVAGLLVKLLGAVFRIPLGNWIGSEGMANYAPAYYVYNFFLILATAGIPVAISRMVSERASFGQFSEAHRVFKISRYLMIAIGCISFVIIFFGADAIVRTGNMPDGSQLAMRSISPALIFVPLMASYRGYFQGMQDMRPTALSQVVEQVFRVIVGLSLAYTMFYGSLSFPVSSTFTPGAKGAAGATLGAAAGAIGGLFVVLIIYAFAKKKIRQNIAREHSNKKESGSSILKKIAVIAVPITIGAAIMPIVNMIDAGMVNARLLAAGWDETAAKDLYGQLTGFAGPLINFPQVLTQAVAMSLVPLVAAANKHKDMLYLRQNVAIGLRTAVILGLPCAMGLFVLAEPILTLLYPNQQVTAVSTAPCLMTLSVGVIFLSTVQTLTGVLQGIGKQMIPVRNLCIGVVVKIILTWTLTGIHSINVLGAATGTVCAYLVASILNIIAVKKYTGTHFDFMTTAVKPVIASTVMALCAWGSYAVLNVLLDGSRLATLVAIAFAALIYIIMLFVTKTITKEEVAKMPKGEKLVKIVSKFVK